MFTQQHSQVWGFSVRAGVCYVLDICLVCVCFVSVLPVRTEWLVSYGVIKLFCEDGSVFANGVYFAQIFILLVRKLAC